MALSISEVLKTVELRKAGRVLALELLATHLKQAGITSPSGLVELVEKSGLGAKDRDKVLRAVFKNEDGSGYDVVATYARSLKQKVDPGVYQLAKSVIGAETAPTINSLEEVVTVPGLVQVTKVDRFENTGDRRREFTLTPLAEMGPASLLQETGKRYKYGVDPDLTDIRNAEKEKVFATTPWKQSDRYGISVACDAMEMTRADQVRVYSKGDEEVNALAVAVVVTVWRGEKKVNPLEFKGKDGVIRNHWVRVKPCTAASGFRVRSVGSDGSEVSGDHDRDDDQPEDLVAAFRNSRKCQNSPLS